MMRAGNGNIGSAPAPLHLVEPTFDSDAGHCRSFVESFCRAAAGTGVPVVVWAGRGARLPAIEGADVTLRRHFRRRVRRVQAYFLYRRLLREPGRILVSTAGRADMTLLTLAAGAPLPAGKATLYFHWFRPSPQKEAFFRATALRQPNLRLLGPTPGVVAPFLAAGFLDTGVVPYPVTRSAPPESPPPFRHFLCAGAARVDKGFLRVAEMAKAMHAAGSAVPIVLQASPEHYGKTEGAVREAVAALKALGHPPLSIVPETLPAPEYAALFPGAVCIQPYDPSDFGDRVSGVTLDALSAGAPVVVPENTWMARAASPGAGIAVPDFRPETLLRAAERIRENYAQYARKALEAGRRLQAENDARHLFGAVAR